MLHSDDLIAMWVTAKLALITTALLLVFGAPLAWWLARTRCRARVVIETLVTLPLILPPTVLGFYLLLLLGAHGPLSPLLRMVGGETLAFSFTGLVIGSIIYSLPFVVRPLQATFATIDPKLLEASATLGASSLDRFRSIVFPLARPGLLTASVLGFAHTVGEFGVVLMIGGNIPGRTRVLSIAIYDHVESFEYARAHVLAGTLLVIAFVLLLGVHLVTRRTWSVTP